MDEQHKKHRRCYRIRLRVCSQYFFGQKTRSVFFFFFSIHYLNKGEFPRGGTKIESFFFFLTFFKGSPFIFFRFLKNTLNCTRRVGTLKICRIFIRIHCRYSRKSFRTNNQRQYEAIYFCRFLCCTENNTVVLEIKSCVMFGLKNTIRNSDSGSLKSSVKLLTVLSNTYSL